MVPMGGNKVSANPELMEKYPEVYTSMGATAEKVAAKFGITRADQDAFARRVAEARGGGAREGVVQRRDRPHQGHRTSTMAGKRAKLTLADDTILRPTPRSRACRSSSRPSTLKGTVTAGNASPLTDGAAAAVLMSESKAKASGVKPLGYFVDFVVAGVPPDIMGIGPVPAVRKLLERNKLTVKDIDVFELNEAFAAQSPVLRCASWAFARQG
jgi:acetyl-CoA acyltransferase